MSGPPDHPTHSLPTTEQRDPSPDPPTYQCHQCQSLLSVDPLQLHHIEKQQQQHAVDDNATESIPSLPSVSRCTAAQSAEAPPPSIQCVYVECPIRSQGLFECEECSKLSRCRHCAMPLCKACSVSLKVLQCAYCDVFICSQHCYKQVMNRHFEFIGQFGLSVQSHPSMHRLRKMLLPPHLYAAIGSVPDECLPFHICEGCKAQNCGCVDWMSCVNCRGYHCAECESTLLRKCALKECNSRTCCRQKEWDRNCDLCLRMGHCDNIFCTKGHCNRHIIFHSEIGFDFVTGNAEEEETPNADDQKETAGDVDESDADAHAQNDGV